MKQKWQYILIVFLFCFLVFLIQCGFMTKHAHIEKSIKVERLPKIDPDYTNIEIPSNIAPLNFYIKEKGIAFYSEIYASNGHRMDMFCTNGQIRIPIKKWKKLLSQNPGGSLYIQIYGQNENGEWKKYQRIINKISTDKIDSFLTYRLINSAYKYWKKMGIYQRNLENFNESPILVNRMSEGNCMNCHSFCNNNPEQMVLHMRGGKGSGTMILNEGKTVKVNTKTDFNKAGAYPSWHPSGNLIAFSANHVLIFYHAFGRSRDVLDTASDLIVYNVDSNTVTSSPQISNTERMETFPNWSPDGQYSYFCSAPKFENFKCFDEKRKDLAFDQIRYDLMRIHYDIETGGWGKVEPILLAEQTGLSITFPRVSPDGRKLLVCMAEYGTFPVYMESSDLYMIDLNTLAYKKLNVNSNRTESFHSWSSNSRWFVFSSKRRDGIHARPYFSHIDEQGNVSKPFLLPQKDPEFYSTFLKTYNVPEMVKGPVKTRPQTIIQIAYNTMQTLNAKLDPEVEMGEQKMEETPIYQQAPK